MAEGKELVTAALVKARAELDTALFELEKLPAVGPDTVLFAAHALNNFLTVTGGTVELLIHALASHSDPQIRSGLEALREVTGLMTHIVAKLSNASSNGGAKLRFDTVDLDLLVQRVCTFYKRKADAKQIHFLLEPPPAVVHAWTDRVALAAVLDNLLSNAVKYSPHGKRVWVSVAAEGDGAVCRVRDEGPGLSADDQARLFQRGVRLTPQPTGGEPSTGYGLAVAKEFIDRLGGTIWCESVLGQGACFAIRLPAARDATHGS
jgi:two-component system, sensor histidine kinase LadS